MPAHALYDLNGRILIGFHVIKHLDIVFKNNIDFARADTRKLGGVILKRRDLDANFTQILICCGAGNRPYFLSLEIIE